MQKPILSKSTFIRGLQCEKSLYLYKHHYKLKDETPAQLQAIFNQGTNVGLLAQDLFPNGMDASPPDHFKMQESVFKTQDFIANGETIIYEATFQYNGVLAALDILVKEADGWKAYEVKSSTSVSDTYIYDAAIQYYTIVNSGIDLKDISIVYINNQYVKNGHISINDLFTIESVFERVQEILPNIPNQIENLKRVIKQEEIPSIDIGAHCDSPYSCDFKGHCWKHIPEYSIFDISNLWASKKFQLYEKGITTFDQIDLDNNPLNSNQLLQVTSELNNTKHIDKKNISAFLNDLTYPIYFLDFETMGSAIPVYDNTRPYQQFVFQYSLHILPEEDGVLKHYEYLAETTTNTDPRIGFVKQLITDCGTSGDILVYNIGFERGKLNDLIELFPQYTNEINNIINRLKDLMIPFQKRWYYTPEMKGSYSIKYVLPALVPELSYQDLEIKEGGTASNIFAEMVSGTFTGDYEKTRKDLLEYCKLDTYAMVKIYEVLTKVSQD
ncbi:putative RecB family nuclease [Oceanihabitans sediminis]|uniref:DUF2779 domain-containing protein n=1 Tax=Oceanihabitans sediminis TaxID=1812012 RepID=A0A368P5A9_9FLAO|nr:DUF2779 domain-containing protein [Oceanihabitans sediminis]RBP32788.1 putative RecB family nuclease [Oceanihabitans sediminis]RCU57678.1 DUF2779 domain-containing protein [Oceanihabitans sediminis]